MRESAAGFMQACNYTATGLLANQAAGRGSPLLRQQLMMAHSTTTPALHGSAVSRSWQYDGAYNVAGIDDARWGRTYYRHNLSDQIVHTRTEGILPWQEQFSYDADQNLSRQVSLPRGAEAVWQQVAQRQQAGRVVTRGSTRYRYDAAGRLAEKHEQKDGFRPQVWRYRCNLRFRLAKSS